MYKKKLKRTNENNIYYIYNIWLNLNLKTRKEASFVLKDIIDIIEDTEVMEALLWVRTIEDSKTHPDFLSFKFQFHSQIQSNSVILPLLLSTTGSQDASILMAFLGASTTDCMDFYSSLQIGHHKIAGVWRGWEQTMIQVSGRCK